MKLDRDSAIRLKKHELSGFRRKDQKEWTDAPLIQTMTARLTGRAPRCVARAPGRLDVIGGFADYTGASVVYLPTSACVHVAVQPRDDDKFFVTDITSPGAAAHEPTVVDSSALFEACDARASNSLRTDLASADPNGVVRSALGALSEAVSAGVLDKLPGGLSLVVHAGNPALGCAGRHAAVSAGVLAALRGVATIDLEVATAARIVRRVAHDWLDTPIGLGDGACAWGADPLVMNTFRCDTETSGDPLPLAPGTTLVGVHCGVRRADALEKFRHAQVTTFMGHSLIRRIVESENGTGAAWNGFLSGIDVGEYVERFRDRVPTKLKGRDFLERFGNFDSAGDRVDGNDTYKIRSRTEHHIYEHARATEFINLAFRAANEPTTDLLASMGDVMYASHWSYGQRCGLGSVETDLLVKLIRQRGVVAGLFGARVSGCGCGGIVTVFLADSDEARASLDGAIADYSSKTGNTVTLLCGSIPGASVTGVRTL